MSGRRRRLKTNVDSHDALMTFAREHLDQLGLSKGFESRLLKDDDWSLVIKLHALIEAALTNSIVGYLGQESMRPIFSRMSAGGVSGKIAFATALKCLTERDQRFVNALSALRNKLAHDVGNVGFKLKAHIQRLAVTERRRFVRDLFFAGVNAKSNAAEQDKAVSLFLRRPKYMLWRTCLTVVASTYVGAELARVKRESPPPKEFSPAALS